MPLSSKDYKSLLEIIEICYSILDRNLMFKLLCERLQKLVPISTAAFIPIDPKTGNPAFNRFSAFNVPDNIVRLFCSHYAPLHPMAKAGLHLIPNQVGNITDVISPAKLAETEYSRGFQSGPKSSMKLALRFLLKETLWECSDSTAKDRIKTLLTGKRRS